MAESGQVRRWRIPRRWWFRAGVVAVFAVVACAGLIAYVHEKVSEFGPPPLEQVFVDVPVPVTRSYELPGGRRLRAAATGNPVGPLVLFVHGTPGRWEDFVWVMRRPELAGRAWLVAVDRPGWGGSAAGGLETSMEAQARALGVVLAEHPANLPAVLVGHSLGAAVAGRMAMDRPDAVGALILVAGSIDPELERTNWYQVAVRLPLLRRVVPELLVRSDDELIPFKQELESMLAGWETLRMPVTVVQGEADRLVPPANADFAERRITRAPLNVRRIPGVGHLIPWQRPDLIVDAVLARLQPAFRAGDVD